MSLGLAHRKELQKRRSQRFWAIVKAIIIISIIVGSSYFAFDTGQEIALRSVEYNKIKFDQQTAELEKIRMELGNTEAALDKLQNLLPNQAMEDLLLVINQKAADGISPERMGSLIAGLSKDGKCEEEPQVKRFAVTTPVSQQQDSSVSFYRGLITLTGKGSPTLNADGNPEAWFDPSKPVTATFTLPGGETQEATGVLPLYHSVVVKDTEYRFTLTAGRRSFTDVTVLSCTL